MTDEEILLETLAIQESNRMTKAAEESDAGKRLAEEAPDAVVAELQRFREIRESADRIRNAAKARAVRQLSALPRIEISFGEDE